jgi:hypothetical protein
LDTRNQLQLQPDSLHFWLDREQDSSHLLLHNAPDQPRLQMHASLWCSVQVWMGKSAKASKQSTIQLELVNLPAKWRRPSHAAWSASQPAAAKLVKMQAAAKLSKKKIFEVRLHFHPDTSNWPPFSLFPAEIAISQGGPGKASYTTDSCTSGGQGVAEIVACKGQLHTPLFTNLVDHFEI